MTLGCLTCVSVMLRLKQAVLPVQDTCDQPVQRSVRGTQSIHNCQELWHTLLSLLFVSDGPVRQHEAVSSMSFGVSLTLNIEPSL